jgi:hypothetical protein
MIPTIPSNQVILSAKVSEKFSALDTWLTLEIHNKTRYNLTFTTSSDFPAVALSCVDAAGRPCPLSEAGKKAYLMHVGTRMHQAVLPPESSRKWRLPLHEYFEPTSGTWTLKEDMMVQLSGDDKGKEGQGARVMFPEVRLVVP